MMTRYKVRLRGVSINLFEFTFVDLDSDDDLDFVAVDDIGNVQYFENIGTAAEFHFSPTSFNRFHHYDTGGTDWFDVRTDKDDQLARDRHPVSIMSETTCDCPSTVIENTCCIW